MTSPQQFISESCSWFHTEDNYQLALSMQSLSGIGLDRLGSFSECSHQPDFRYFLLKYLVDGSDELCYTGICYSSNCSSQDLMYVTRSINEYIPLPFHDYQIYEPHSSMHFWNTYTIAFFALSGLVLVLVALASLVDLLARRSKQELRHKIIEYLSVVSCFNFLFQKSSNNERVHVMTGLRAYAFLGMTLYSLTFMFESIPSSPQEPPVQKWITPFFFNFDLWLLISGFYFAYQVSKNWSKDPNTKLLFFAVAGKLIKMAVITYISVLWINHMVYSMGTSPLWTITLDFFDSQCRLYNLFGQCNYGLWVWVTELQMCLITSLMFLLWHSGFAHSKKVYMVANLLFVVASFLQCYFFGRTTDDDSGLEGMISKSPTVAGIAYLLGFNLGLMYFYFRSTRNKSRILTTRILRYRTCRVMIPIMGICIIAAIFLYFGYLDSELDPRVNQSMYFVFKIVAPLGYVMLVVGELMGFQNPLGSILKDHFMSAVSKLSFCTYTIFYGVTLMIINSRKEDLYVNTAKVLCLWVCSLAISILGGFALCLLVEIPLYRMLNAWLGHNHPKSFIEFN